MPRFAACAMCRFAMFTIAAAAVSGCAGAGDRYPSLAVRDAERYTGMIPAPPSSDPETAPIPAVSYSPEQVSNLVDSARTAHARFVTATPGAAQSIARASGASAEDNRYADAAIALANLDSIRSETAAVMANLDALHADLSNTFAESEQVNAAREQVGEMLAQEDDELSRLARRFPSPS